MHGYCLSTWGAASVPVIAVMGAAVAVSFSVTAGVAGAAIFRSSERSRSMVPVTVAVVLLPVISLLVSVISPFATFPLPLQRSKRWKAVLVS